MEIGGADRFRIRAYQNALTAIEASTFSIYDLWKKGRLHEIPGIGPSLAQHIGELFEKGRVEEFESLKEDLPDGMFSLIGIQGIGPKRAYKLASAFNLENRDTALDRVAKAAEEGQIQELDGFGEKSEKQILEAISDLKKTKNEKERLLWVQADQIVQRVYEYMKQLDSVIKIEALGSYRRKKETVGDIDFAVATEKEAEVMNHFLKFPEIKEVLVQGEKKASVVLGTDFQLDIRVVAPEQYGSMVQYFTGSKYHNISLRTYSLEKGYSVSEYGIKEIKTKKVHQFSSEENFYNFLDLAWITPEIRQGKNEVDLAANKNLPNLITRSAIKGDLHMHTILSDGINTLEEMVEAAHNLGYEYVGISDHSPSVQSRGYAEVESIIEETRLKIRELNQKYTDMKILFGYEVNLLADSTLSLPDALLEKLDYVIVGVHTSFKQDREKLMNRYMAALENPYVDIIAHPTGRIINQRDALDLDWMTLFDAVKKHDKILEIDSWPDRLDLPYDLVREAKNRGIRLIISSDAHRADRLDFIRYGVDVARRGWCEPKDIVNTLSGEEFLGKVLKL